MSGDFYITENELSTCPRLKILNVNLIRTKERTKARDDLDFSFIIFPECTKTKIKTKINI